MFTQTERTSCACADCIACCKRQPGPLAPGDVEKIASFLGRSEHDVLSTTLWASPGVVLGNSKTGDVLRIGTITPRVVDGRCVFLSADDRCSIHPVAPAGCAFFDTHMDEATAQERGLRLYRAIVLDPNYQAVRRALIPATSWRPVTA